MIHWRGLLRVYVIGEKVKIFFIRFLAVPHNFRSLEEQPRFKPCFLKLLEVVFKIFKGTLL